ncbi:MAG: hypothetical protein ACM3XZ_00555 [Betaproteobacteria bacterium]
MKVQIAVLTVALAAGVILWWKMSGRASGPTPFPEIPLPPGTTVLKRLESLVNLQSTRLIIAGTVLSPADVDRFYRTKLVGTGWREEAGEAVVGTERRPLTFRRGGWECTAFAFPADDTRLTRLLLQLRPAGSGQRRSQLARGVVSGRLNGFPLFPGVDGALLIESGSRRGPITILFETGATLGKVVEFYRRHLDRGEKPFPSVSGAMDWASGTYRFRQWSVLVNLCRRPAGGTSALVILTPAQTEAKAEMEVRACSGGATF